MYKTDGCSVTDRARSNEHIICHHPVNCFCTKHVCSWIK